MKKIETMLQIAYIVGIGLFVFFVFIATLFLPDKRIVIRSDELYEVQLRYGMDWCEMGGPYKTIEEARERIKYWENFDKEKIRNKSIKRTVVE